MESYAQVLGRLLEWGTASGQVAAERGKLDAGRDRLVWDAHHAGVSKAEISRVTGLSWATVDRIVRDMAGKNGSSESGG